MSTATRRRNQQSASLCALIVCALATLSTSARAESYLDGGTELNETDATTSWAKDKTSVGTFGAGFTAGYTECNSGSSACTGGTSQYVSAYGAINAELFGSGEFQAGEIEATGSSAGATYDVYFGTAKVLSEPATAFTAQSLTASKSEEVFKVEYQLIIVVVPITAEFDLEADEGLSISGSLSSSSSEDQISWTLTPAVSSTVVASISVGTEAFNVGIEVNCDIYAVALPVTLMLDYQPQIPQVGYSIDGVLSLTTLDGSIAAYAHALFLDYRYTLFDWAGITLSSQTIFTDGTPTASNPYVDLTAGYQATGQYSYADSHGYAESGSTYQWSFCFPTANCSDPFPLGTTDTQSMIGAPSVGYLMFCVTPKNGYNFGPQQCSPWTYTGPEISFIDGANNTNTVFAPQSDQVPSGTCFNMPSTFVDKTTKISAFPSTSALQLRLYSGSSCSGTLVTPATIAANTNTTIDLSSYNFSDQVASFELIYNDAVAADVMFYVIPSWGASLLDYSFSSAGGLSESGSTYTLQQATDSSGDSATTVASGTIKATGAVQYDHLTAGTYLDFCVTPSDGFLTGSQSCSGWTEVADNLTWYTGESETGTSATFGVTNGMCLNSNIVTNALGAAPASLALIAPANTTLTINMFTGTNCTGTEYSKSTGVGTTHNINLDSAGIGSSLASYEVTW